MVLEDRLEMLKQQSYKITKTRKSVLAFFEAEHRPLNAREIIAHLHENGQKVNKTTLYRELKVLLSLDFIKETRISDEEMHYETTSMEHHHHLVCTNCPAIEGIASDDLEYEIAKLESDVLKERGFKINMHMLEFFGLCTNCQKGATA